MAGNQANQQDRLNAIKDLEQQVDALRLEIGDLANQRRAAYSCVSEPIPQKREEKSLSRAKIVAAGQELAQLNREIKGKIPSVHRLRHPIDDFMDECCQWVFNGDFRQLRAWRIRIGKVYPIDEQDVQDHGCEPLLAVLQVYKSTLAKLENMLRQSHSAEEPAAVPPESPGPVLSLVERPKRSQGKQANEERNRKIAHEADMISKRKLTQKQLGQFRTVMVSQHIAYIPNKELGDEKDAHAWGAANCDALHGKIRHARDWCKKHPGNSEA